MSRYRRLLRHSRYALLLLLLMAGVAASGCGSTDSRQSPGQESSIQSLTRDDGGPGGITFEATVATPQYMAGLGHPPDHFGFLVRLDTHSGNLLGHDLSALTELRDDSGGAAQALGWEPESDGSHHRSGLLYFARTRSDGQPAVAPDAQYVELSLKDLGGVPERVLRWELPLPAFQGSPGESPTGTK